MALRYGGLSCRSMKRMRAQIQVGKENGETCDAGSRKNASLGPKVFVEKIQGPLPSQLGRRLIVTWRCVVMETMVDALINVHGVGHVIRLKRFLVSRPSFGDACIKRCVVKQKWRLDSGGICGRGLTAVKWNRGRQIRKSRCQLIGHGSAKAETHDPDFTRAFGTRFQPGG